MILFETISFAQLKDLESNVFQISQIITPREVEVLVRLMVNDWFNHLCFCLSHNVINSEISIDIFQKTLLKRNVLVGLMMLINIFLFLTTSFWTNCLKNVSHFTNTLDADLKLTQTKLKKLVMIMLTTEPLVKNVSKYWKGGKIQSQVSSIVKF